MSKSELRCFNEAGIAAFETALTEMTIKKSYIPLDSIITNDAFGMNVTVNKVIESKEFASRMECGRYFHELFESVGPELRATGIDPLTDRGLWSWIAAYWGELLLKNSKGNFYVGTNARYILEPTAFRNYRHLLAGPFFLFDAWPEQPDLIEIAMTKLVTQDNPFFEQIASRRDIVSNPAALEIIRSCYFDEGAGHGFEQAAKGSLPGDLSRFGSLYSQLAVNFDLKSMKKEEIETLLPEEFRTWVQGNPPEVKKRAKPKLGRKRTKRRKKV
jgi:hypothetical protein